MDENKTTEETKPDNAVSDADKGSKLKAIGKIERAELVAERIEAANAKAEELVERKEEAAAKLILGGQAEAGQTPVKKEIDSEQYARDVLEGKINNDKE